MKRLLALLALSSYALFAQTITAVQNNYGRTASTDASYGIAEGSIFIVKGTGFYVDAANPQTLQNAPLQTTLFKVRVRITANGVIYYAPIYYVLGTQIAAILPSNVPAGNATVLIENNGTNSAPFTFKVVKSAFGMLAWDFENGSGRAIVVRYPSGTLAGLSAAGTTNVLNPGDIVLLYGSGLGPGPIAEDSAAPNPTDMTGIPISITIGGATAQVAYHGRSTFVGLDQLTVVIPTLTTYSCDIAMIITTNGVVANATTIPVAATGTTCTPANNGGGGGDGGSTSNPLSQADIDRIVAQGSYKQGKLTVARLRTFTASNLNSDSSLAAFTTQSGPDLRKQLENKFADGFPFVAGTCVNYNGSLGPPAYNITSTNLDAGPSVTLQGPAGTRTLLKTSSTPYNLQTGNATAGNFNDPGRYTFTGGGGVVGAFSISVDVPSELVWTNRASVATVTRSAGVTINWTGGEPNTLVSINSYSYTTGAAQQGSFFCFANQSAGTFNIPSSVTSQLPVSSGGGSLTVSGNGKVALGSAVGLDNIISTSTSTTVQTTVYQ